MPERETTTVDHPEHGEIEVPVPEGYVPEDRVRENYMPKSTFQEELRRRMSGKRDPDELLEDEDFLERVADRRSDFFADRFGEGGGEGDGPDPEKLRSQWEETDLKPVAKERDQWKEEALELRRSRIPTQIARARFEENLPIKDKIGPLLEDYYERRTKWHEEHGEVFLVDDNGEFVYSPSPEEGLPYMTIAEDLEKKYRSGDYTGDWFDENGRPGADVGSPGSGSGRRGRVTSEQFQEMSPAERRQLKEQSYDRWKELHDERREEGMAALTSTGPGI